MALPKAKEIIDYAPPSDQAAQLLIRAIDDALIYIAPTIKPQGQDFRGFENLGNLLLSRDIHIEISTTLIQ
jgi:hypothetical protein